MSLGAKLPTGSTKPTGGDEMNKSLQRLQIPWYLPCNFDSFFHVILHYALTPNAVHAVYTTLHPYIISSLSASAGGRADRAHSPTRRRHTEMHGAPDIKPRIYFSTTHWDAQNGIRNCWNHSKLICSWYSVCIRTCRATSQAPKRGWVHNT